MNKNQHIDCNIPFGRQYGFRQWVWWSVIVLLMMGTLAGCSGGKQENLAIGDTAPDFTLPATNGKNVSLEDYKGKQPVLLYFHMAVG